MAYELCDETNSFAVAGRVRSDSAGLSGRGRDRGRGRETGVGLGRDKEDPQVESSLQRLVKHWVEGFHRPVDLSELLHLSHKVDSNFAHLALLKSTNLGLVHVVQRVHVLVLRDLAFRPAQLGAALEQFTSSDR